MTGGEVRPEESGEERWLCARLRARPQCENGYLALAARLVQRGRTAEACEVLRAGLARVRRPAPLSHLLGLVLCGAGRSAAGLRHLRRAVEAEPGRADYRRDLAFALGAAGRPRESLSWLREAVFWAAGAEGSEAGAGGLGWLLRLAERAAAGAGETHRGKRPRPPAAAGFDRAGSSGTGAEDAVPVRRPPRPSRHAAAVERLVARDPSVVEALVSRKGGPPQARRETLRAARRALARRLARRPGHADLHLEYALLSEALGEVDRAIRATERALRINPDYAEAYLLAVRLYEKAGRTGRAVERCRRAADLRPRWPDVYLALGRLLEAEGRSSEAAEARQRARALGAAEAVRVGAGAGGRPAPCGAQAETGGGGAAGFRGTGPAGGAGADAGEGGAAGDAAAEGCGDGAAGSAGLRAEGGA